MSPNTLHYKDFLDEFIENSRKISVDMREFLRKNWVAVDSEQAILEN